MVKVQESSSPATSPGIVPRWEWRTFGERFGEAEAAFDARTPERVQESDELYLLSVAGGDTVKVRDELMDVKHLERVDDNGLEQWLPVLKAEFPLPGADRRVGARVAPASGTVARAGRVHASTSSWRRSWRRSPRCVQSKSTSGGRATRSAAA